MNEELDAGVLKLVKALNAERERADKLECELAAIQNAEACCEFGRYLVSERVKAEARVLEVEERCGDVMMKLENAEAALARVREIAAIDPLRPIIFAMQEFDKQIPALAADKGADHAQG